MAKGTEPTKLEPPLVLTVNCLHDCELERDFLKDVARVQSITAFSKAHVPLLKQVAFPPALPCSASLHNSTHTLVTSSAPAYPSREHIVWSL